MFPSEKPFPLVSNRMPPHAGRSLRARDFALPRPYRRKPYVEDGMGMSRLRKMGLAMSSMAIAGLIATLVMLARDNLDAPPIPVIAAPLPPAAPVAVAAGPAAQAQPPRTVVPADLPLAVQGREPKVVAAPPAIKAVRSAPTALKPAIEAPDPDVLLITAILTLTPPPEPEPEPE